MQLEQIESQRRALEANVEKLRRSLKHWQTWELEYEGLKEELASNEPHGLTELKLLDISKTYDGTLVNEQEVRDLTGLNADSPRPYGQIVGLINRRLEYGVKNLETISRQYFAAEGKLEEFAFASAAASGDDPRFGDEDSPPDMSLVEIHEELDDHDNVISSELRRPQQETSKIIDSLKQAGLTEKDLINEGQTRARSTNGGLAAHAPQTLPLTSALAPPHKDLTQISSAVEETSNVDHDHQSRPTQRPPIRKKSVSFSVDTKPAEGAPRSDSQEGRKSVSFAAKVAVAPAADPPDSRSVSFSSRVEEIPAEPGASYPESTNTALDAEKQKDLRASFNPGDKVYELNENDEPPAQYIVVPEGESAEDAQTRREMLNYHLNEVGNVVAEMDLEEADADGDDHSDFTSSEYFEDGDTSYTSGMSDEDEDEDDYGRTKNKPLSEEYHEEMKDLQARLIGNLGAQPNDNDIQAAAPDLNLHDVRKLVIRDGGALSSSTTSSQGSDSGKKGGSKKRVSFSEELDVAEPGSPPMKAQKKSEGENVVPVTDEIMQRSTALSHSLPDTNSSNRTTAVKKPRAVPTPYNDDLNVSTLLSSEPSRASRKDTGNEHNAFDATMSVDGPILADSLVERGVSTIPAEAPSVDDEDPIMARRELAADYYRRRNDIVKQQGGFKDTTDEDEQYGELMEERDGKLKKVSRFKAARIRG